jgi:hypothetical protein
VFWRWWWRNSVPAEVKVPLALLLVAMLTVAGYFAAGRLSGASAADNSRSYVLERTVRNVVTVREHGRLVVRRVPVVVRRVVVQSQTATAYQTVVSTTPGGTRYVVRKQVQYVPTVQQRVVNVIVSHTDTVVQPVTSIQTSTVTLPAETVTETRTVTVPLVTTVTITVTEPVTT